MLARIAMIAITTSNSIRVNARRLCAEVNLGLWFEFIRLCPRLAVFPRSLDFTPSTLRLLWPFGVSSGHRVPRCTTDQALVFWYTIRPAHWQQEPFPSAHFCKRATAHRFCSAELLVLIRLGRGIHPAGTSALTRTRKEPYARLANRRSCRLKSALLHSVNCRPLNRSHWSFLSPVAAIR
jgi:hypothetical protein